MGNRVKQRWKSVIMPLVFLLGFALLAYPSVSDYWNSFHQSEAIMSYSESVSKMSETDYASILASAKNYNATHGINWNFSDQDKAAYNTELNLNKKKSSSEVLTVVWRYFRRYFFGLGIPRLLWFNGFLLRDNG